MNKKTKSVLHITNWHPNKENPFEAIWMQRHVQALATHCKNEVWHIQVKTGNKWRMHKYTDEYSCHHHIWEVPLKRWFFLELLTTFLLWRVLFFKIKRKNFDLINFHIAYPLLSYWGWFRSFIKQSRL